MSSWKQIPQRIRDYLSHYKNERQATASVTGLKLASEDSRRHIKIGAAQSTGREREHNEDMLFTLCGGSDGENPIPDFGLFIVADGIGGQHSGEIASSISVRTAARLLIEKTLLSQINSLGHDSSQPLLDSMRDALEVANQSVVKTVPGGGTTFTAALMIGGQIAFGHVGDSRAYILTDEGTTVVTRDHSQAQRLRELGILSTEEAVAHPQRNVLYRAIGQGPNLEVDTFTHPIPVNGHLLICSDGLWGVVPDEEIEHIIRRTGDVQRACELLVRSANRAGGPDNISVVLVSFPEG